MPKTATVNYHVHADTRQSYQLDAGGVAGQLISPEHAVTQVQVLDTRSETTVEFDRDSVAFFDAPSAITDFADTTAWRDTYDQELASLLKHAVAAEEVIVFDHTIRVDDPAAIRKPARNVHSDYSPDGAEQRLIDILGPEAAAMWSAGHYAFINVWRPIEHAVNSAPLAFVRPDSVQKEDWILIDLIYPDRKGHIMGLVGNPAHTWIYRSSMTPRDVAVFNIYDNSGQPSVAHSALDMVEDPTISRPRKSIESRTLVRYAAPDAKGTV